MIKFVSTLPEDRTQVLEWITSDPYHVADASDESASLFITGLSSLAGAIEDKQGRVLYVQFRPDGEFIRLGVQFAPESLVSKIRIAKTILQAMPALKKMAEEKGAKGFIFESYSPTLIQFMSTFGFKPYKGNDYVWIF